MRSNRVKPGMKLAWLPIVLSAALAACGGSGQGQSPAAGTEDLQAVYPANYKADLLAYLRVYLNDPTRVREAYISEPEFKSIGRGSRYVTCLKFNARKSNGEYGGSNERVAIYLGGKLDQVSETPRELCAGAKYQPFPELEKLRR